MKWFLFALAGFFLLIVIGSTFDREIEATIPALILSAGFFAWGMKIHEQESENQKPNKPT